MTEQTTRNMSAQKIIILGIVIFFSVIAFFSSVISPETGEKILYGKHSPVKSATNLEYSEIILSGNYVCMESASKKANGNMSNFVEEFNKCNGKKT
jgi:hypothetical protein